MPARYLAVENTGQSLFLQLGANSPRLYLWDTPHFIFSMVHARVSLDDCFLSNEKWFGAVWLFPFFCWVMEYGQLCTYVVHVWSSPTRSCVIELIICGGSRLSKSGHSMLCIEIPEVAYLYEYLLVSA